METISQVRVKLQHIREYILRGLERIMRNKIVNE